MYNTMRYTTGDICYVKRPVCICASVCDLVSKLCGLPTGCGRDGFDQMADFLHGRGHLLLHSLHNHQYSHISYNAGTVPNQQSCYNTCSSAEGQLHTQCIGGIFPAPDHVETNTYRQLTYRLMHFSTSNEMSSLHGRLWPTAAKEACSMSRMHLLMLSML